MCPSAPASTAERFGAAPNSSPVRLGDPVAWFSARTIGGAAIDLHVEAGRWVVLAFIGALDDSRALGMLAPLRSEAHRFDGSGLRPMPFWVRSRKIRNVSPSYAGLGCR